MLGSIVPGRATIADGVSGESLLPRDTGLDGHAVLPDRSRRFTSRAVDTSVPTRSMPHPLARAWKNQSIAAMEHRRPSSDQDIRRGAERRNVPGVSHITRVINPEHADKSITPGPAIAHSSPSDLFSANDNACYDAFTTSESTRWIFTQLADSAIAGSRRRTPIDPATWRIFSIDSSRSLSPTTTFIPLQPSRIAPAWMRDEPRCCGVTGEKRPQSWLDLLVNLDLPPSAVH